MKAASDPWAPGSQDKARSMSLLCRGASAAVRLSSLKTSPSSEPPGLSAPHTANEHARLATERSGPAGEPHLRETRFPD